MRSGLQEAPRAYSLLAGGAKALGAAGAAGSGRGSPVMDGGDQLNELRQKSGRWKLVEVSGDDMLEIKVETGHDHSILGSEPLIRRGQTVREAVSNLHTLDPNGKTGYQRRIIPLSTTRQTPPDQH